MGSITQTAGRDYRLYEVQRVHGPPALALRTGCIWPRVDANSRMWTNVYTYTATRVAVSALFGNRRLVLLMRGQQQPVEAFGRFAISECPGETRGCNRFSWVN